MISQNITFNDSDKGSGNYYNLSTKAGWATVRLYNEIHDQHKAWWLMIFVVYNDIHGASALGCCKGFGLNSTLATSRLWPSH